MIGAVLASAGFLNRRPMEQTEGPLSPRPSMSTLDDGLLQLAAASPPVSPPVSAGPAGAPAPGPATTPGRTSTPPTGGGVATTKGGPAGAWNFEENKGTLAADSSGNQRAAMLCGGAVWGAGHDSVASLRLVSDACAYATGAMLRTDTAFTVAAWVNLDLGAGESVALSQEGSQASAFYLMYHAGSPVKPARWCMRMPLSDSADIDAEADAVEACAAATPGRWTHLIGVHDPGARQVRLHVNGARAATVSHPGMMWRALGYFYMGRGRHSGDDFHRWQGSIDDVRVFDYAVTDQQAADLFRGKG